MGDQLEFQTTEQFCTLLDHKQKDKRLHPWEYWKRWEYWEYENTENTESSELLLRRILTLAPCSFHPLPLSIRLATLFYQATLLLWPSRPVFISQIANSHQAGSGKGRPIYLESATLWLEWGWGGRGDWGAQCCRTLQAFHPTHSTPSKLCLGEQIRHPRKGT